MMGQSFIQSPPPPRSHSLGRLTHNHNLRTPNAGVSLCIDSTPDAKSGSQSWRQDTRQYASHAAVARRDTCTQSNPSSNSRIKSLINADMEETVRLASGSPLLMPGVNSEERESENEFQMPSFDLLNIRYDMCNKCQNVNGNPGLRQGLCDTCYATRYPMAPSPARTKVRENATTNALRIDLPLLLQKLLPGIDFSEARFDSRVDGGQSEFRPDYFLHCGGHNVVVEVDENGHANSKKYPPEKEEKRLIQIVADGGGLPAWVIRFNPDSFNKEGERIKSCFKYDKNRKLVLDNVLEWNTRLTVLLVVVMYAVLFPPPENVKVVKLFFTEK